MHYWTPWIIAFILYFGLAALWYWAVQNADCAKTRRILNSWQVWSILRFGAWTVLAMIFGGVQAAIAVFVFTIIELLFAWICYSNCGWGRRRKFKKGKKRSRKSRGSSSESDCDWRRYDKECIDWCDAFGKDSGSSSSSDSDGKNKKRGSKSKSSWRERRRCFWRYVIFNVFLELAAVAFGSQIVMLGYLNDGGYVWNDQATGTRFWVSFAIIGIIGVLLYTWIVRRAASDFSKRILLDPRTWNVLLFFFWLIGGMLTGAPWYYALVGVILWEIFERVFRCISYEFRETWCRTLEDIVIAVVAFAIGSYWLRYAIWFNIYASYYMNGNGNA